MQSFVNGISMVIISVLAFMYANVLFLQRLFCVTYFLRYANIRKRKVESKKIFTHITLRSQFALEKKSDISTTVLELATKNFSENQNGILRILFIGYVFTPTYG